MFLESWWGEEHRAELRPPRGGVPKPCKGLLDIPSQRGPQTTLRAGPLPSVALSL